jgi:DNA polymerase III subunit gamma/tau
MPWAIKYRPKILDDVLGQVYPKQVIRGALEKAVRGELGAVSWLFTGPFGGGKTTTIRIIAKALACIRPTISGEACQVCQSCLAIEQDNSQNYTEIDAASRSGAEDIRDLIQEAFASPIGGSPSRVIALDEAHVLSKTAQNVLLKTLEENPPSTHIMLITTDPQKLLPTIISRCIKIDLQPVERPLVVEHLKKVSALENVDCEQDALEAIVLATHGHVRDALTLAETVAMAGPITLANVKHHLHLDLDEYVVILLAKAGLDWDETEKEVEKLTQDYPPHELWAALKRVVIQAELSRLSPSRSNSNDQVKKVVERFGGRLPLGAEWALGKGNQLAVRTASDLVVALAVLQDQLGGGVVQQTTKKDRALGQPKRKRAEVGFSPLEKSYSQDDFAAALGFEPEGQN